MSRSVIQTSHLADGSKILIFDQNQVTDDAPLYRVIRWGDILPKGDKPLPEHIHQIRAASKGAPKTTFAMTRNLDGKYKIYAPDKAKKNKVAKDASDTATKAKKAKPNTQAETIAELTSAVNDLKRLVAITKPPPSTKKVSIDEPKKSVETKNK